MLLKYLFLSLCGVSFGALAAAGVFTVLVAVGLMPRFAGKTDTAKYIFLYENWVVIGTIFGMLFSIFEGLYPYSAYVLSPIAPIAKCIFGFFVGCFVGCLALAIAEMLDSIPIFARRVRLRWGIGIVIFMVALGKMAGGLLYFLAHIR